MPPKNAWGCEDAVAAEAWRRYFDGRTLKDRRIGRKVEVVEMKVGVRLYTLGIVVYSPFPPSS